MLRRFEAVLVRFDWVIVVTSRWGVRMWLFGNRFGVKRCSGCRADTKSSWVADGVVGGCRGCKGDGFENWNGIQGELHVLQIQGIVGSGPIQRWGTIKGLIFWKKGQRD